MQVVAVGYFFVFMDQLRLHIYGKEPRYKYFAVLHAMRIFPNCLILCYHKCFLVAINAALCFLFPSCCALCTPVNGACVKDE